MIAQMGPKIVCSYAGFHTGVELYFFWSQKSSGEVYNDIVLALDNYLPGHELTK